MGVVEGAFFISWNRQTVKSVKTRRSNMSAEAFFFQLLNLVSSSAVRTIEPALFLFLLVLVVSAIAIDPLRCGRRFGKHQRQKVGGSEGLKRGEEKWVNDRNAPDDTPSRTRERGANKKRLVMKSIETNCKRNDLGRAVNHNQTQVQKRKKLKSSDREKQERQRRMEERRKDRYT